MGIVASCSRNTPITSSPPPASSSVIRSEQGADELSKESANYKLISHNEGKVNSWNAKRAYGYLTKICEIGSRTTGTIGMQKQQVMLEEHFEKNGATVLWQPFEERHPQTGVKVEIKNMIVQWMPERKERVFLCTHYDTRPFPSMDPRNPRGLFVGANDGGSGTALFMELAHIIPSIATNVGVDLIFFDAEELVFEENRDAYFLGSKYFANSYVDDPTSPRYRCGILLDMIGDSDLQLYYEENSFKFARSLAEEVWGIAKELRIKEFEPKVIHFVRDDHLPLNEIAKIPVIDIIDFDYPRGRPRNKGFWHTMADTPDKCSGESLVKVGRVLEEWLKRQK